MAVRLYLTGTPSSKDEELSITVLQYGMVWLLWFECLQQAFSGGRKGMAAAFLPPWESRLRLLLFSLQVSQDIEDDLIAENILTLCLHHAMPLESHAAH